MEGTAFVDSYPDLDGYRQTVPLLPVPVAGVLLKSLESFQSAYAKWLEEKNRPQQGFSRLTERDLKEIRASKEVSWKVAERYGVSKATIVRARAGVAKAGRPLKIPRL